MKIRYGLTVLSLSGLMLAMTACSYLKGYPDANTIEFLKSGSLRETSVEEYSEEYYDLEELRNLIMDSVNSYNEENENAINIDLYDVKGRTVRLVMTYRDTAAYEAFNTQPLFAGSVEGYGREIPAEVVFYEKGEDQALKETGEKPDLSGMTLYVVTEPVDVITDGQIEYVSGDVELTGPSSCHTGESISEKNPAYIAARTN